MGGKGKMDQTVPAFCGVPAVVRGVSGVESSHQRRPRWQMPVGTKKRARTTTNSGFSTELQWIGQDEAVGHLEWFVENTVPPRILFCGPRGTGKNYLAERFLEELRYRNVIGEYATFYENERKRAVRQWLEEAKGGNHESELPVAYILCESLLENTRIREQVLLPSKVPIIEIILTGDQDESFIKDFTGYRVSFFPLPDFVCAQVLRHLGMRDQSENGIAISASGGCYQTALEQDQWMRTLRRDLPWDQLRLIPPSGFLLAQNDYDAHEKLQKESQGAFAASFEKLAPPKKTSVVKILEISRLIAKSGMNVYEQVELLSFLDHLYAMDMKKCSDFLSGERKAETIDDGIGVHLAITEAMEQLYTNLDAELVWNSALLKSGG